MKRLVKTGMLFAIPFMAGCAVISDIRLDSDPPGAAVYLVPKYMYERYPELLTDQEKLAAYRVPEGDTPVVTRAREMVYVAIFVLGDKTEIRELDVLNPPYENSVKAIFK